MRCSVVRPDVPSVYGVIAAIFGINTFTAICSDPGFLCSGLGSELCDLEYFENDCLAAVAVLADHTFARLRRQDDEVCCNISDHIFPIAVA